LWSGCRRIYPVFNPAFAATPLQIAAFLISFFRSIGDDRKAHKIALQHNKALYRDRHRIENVFVRLKDWRRIATREDRCVGIFLSACALAAVILFWL